MQYLPSEFRTHRNVFGRYIHDSSVAPLRARASDEGPMGRRQPDQRQVRRGQSLHHHDARAAGRIAQADPACKAARIVAGRC